MNKCAKMLNHIANIIQPKKYLEIGVAAGETFAEVNVPLKHAVDPNFLFDHLSRETSDARYFKMTSDAYFDSDEAFYDCDLFFIDGLHTFDQTLIDLINCINRSAPSSVIVVDDVMPVDIWSALPDQSMAYDYRRRFSPSMHYAWHGDVFKIPFFIAHYLPNFQYRTVMDQDNFRTVLWKGVRVNKTVVPRLNLEQISRLSFMDIGVAESIFQMATLKMVAELLSKRA